MLLVDERAPLTLTSDKSTECYRNWWAGPDGAMVALMNRSIDLLEGLAAESGNVFNMTRRGYLYATADPTRTAQLEASGRLAEAQGAGPLRVHASAAHDAYLPAAAEGIPAEPTGADLLTDPALIRRHFPYLAPETVAVLHARRCGWFSGQQLGMYLLERARAAGVRLANARLAAVDTAGGRVRAVRLETPGATREVATPCLVIAAGPMLQSVAGMIGVSLPVFSEPHLKVAFRDVRAAIPREAPMLIWCDPQRLDWDATERTGLAEDPRLEALAGELPPGPHARPEGGAAGDNVLALWNYHEERLDAPRFPMAVPPHYAEVTLRGMSAMVPALRAYRERLPRVVIDGGYYTKTPENRPLCGPLPVEGAYVDAGLSGFGLMGASATGELLAAHVTGAALPGYAPAFLPSRFDDPAYREALAAWDDTGQL